MQPRRKMGSVPAHPEGISRIGTASSSAWYQRWLALDDHRLHLLDRTCKIQQQLEREAGWFGLSDVARTEIEQKSGLFDLEVALRLVHRRLRRWLQVVPTLPADDMAVVTASLEVAKRLLPAEENPVVHGMLTRAVRDLRELKNPS